VIALDTNILVYAHRADSPFHDRAKRILVALAEGPEAFAIPWPCIHEFLAVVTNPKIFKTPTPLEGAFAQLEAWIASPRAVLIGEEPAYLAHLKRLLLDGHVRGAKVHDARVAALAISHGARELLSADRDFSRFPALTVRNPL
jgi:hypothetical protein